MKHILKKLVHYLIVMINIVFFCFVFFLLYVSIFRPELMISFKEWMWEIIKTLGYRNYAVAFIAAWVEAVPIAGTMLPGSIVLMLVWGFFGKQYLVSLIIVAVLWSIAGDIFSYVVGWYFGERFLHKYGTWFGVGPTEVSYLKKGIHRRWFWAVMGSKFHGMARAFIPFLAWSMRMSQKTFLRSNIIASVFWTTAMVILGVVFKSYYDTVVQYIRYVVIGLMVCGILYVYFFKREAFKKYMDDKEAEIEKAL